MSTARIPEIRARLDSWAIWLRTGSTGCGSSPIASLEWVSDGYRPWVPVDSIECSVTDDAVSRLPMELKLAVADWHMNDGTLEAAAKRLKISRMTLCRRLRAADEAIAHWLELRRSRFPTTGPTRREAAG